MWKYGSYAYSVESSVSSFLLPWAVHTFPFWAMLKFHLFTLVVKKLIKVFHFRSYVFHFAFFLLPPHRDEIVISGDPTKGGLTKPGPSKPGTTKPRQVDISTWQCRKLRTISLNFACFGPHYFRGQPPKFWTCIEIQPDTDHVTEFHCDRRSWSQSINQTNAQTNNIFRWPNLSSGTTARSTGDSQLMPNK